MGATDFTMYEAQEWTGLLADVITELAGSAPVLSQELKNSIGQASYYLTGMRAMLERGFHRETVFPCWRALFHIAGHPETKSAVAERGC